MTNIPDPQPDEHDTVFDRRLLEIEGRIRQVEREQAWYEWWGPFRHLSPRWRGLDRRIATLRGELAEIAARLGR